MNEEKRFYDPEYCQYLEEKVQLYQGRFIPSGTGWTPHGEYKLTQDLKRKLK